MAKRVLITGAAGQDAAYLARACLAAGDTVWATNRPGVALIGSPIDEMGLLSEVAVIERELNSVETIRAILNEAAPDQIYNLAGQSSVAQSFVDPVGAADANAMIPLYFIEAMHTAGSQAAFVQASTGEVFGAAEGVCDEATTIAPLSPYAVTKAFAQHMIGAYRAAYRTRASSAILFAHESPYRGAQFLTRKVTLTLAKIRHGLADRLELGNLDAERDWGFAEDYMQGMRLIASAPIAEDFVLASGESHSVRDFVTAAADWFGYRLEWRGTGVGEVGIDTVSGKTIVEVNPDFFRPIDTPRFLGSPKKAETVLGWKRTLDFTALVHLMAAADDRKIAAGKAA